MTERERRRRIVDYLRSGKSEDAAAELAASREAYPGDGMLHHAIGLAFASRGTLDRARDQLEAAAKLGPESADILADLAQVRLAQGDVQGAIEAAESALALNPKVALARFTLGRACLSAECARQARGHRQPSGGHAFPLIDGRTPLYLRAMREMEGALEALPPFANAVRGALAFAYLRAGHYHAAAEQLKAELDELPPGEEADRVRTRLLHSEHEIVRERYWSPDELDVEAMEEAGRAPDAAPETVLRLAHAYAVCEDEDAMESALGRALALAYHPRTALVSRTVGEGRFYQQVSDAHVLIAGGLECIMGGELRFLPFSALESVTLAQSGLWRSAAVRFTSGEEADVVVPSLYRLSLRSPNDLIQSGRFTQFSYAPGETRYAHAIGVRNLATEDGTIPFGEVAAIEFP